MRKIFVALIALLVCSQAYAAPVNIGGFEYVPVTKTYTDGSGTVSGQSVWNPASGKMINLLGVSFSSDDAMDFTLETGITLDGSGSVVLDSTTVVPRTANTASGVTTIGNGTPIWKGSADAELYLGTFGGETDAAGKSTLLLWGYESGR